MLTSLYACLRMSCEATRVILHFASLGFGFAFFNEGYSHSVDPRIKINPMGLVALGSKIASLPIQACRLFAFWQKGGPQNFNADTVFYPLYH